jgi:hypothetical protein
MKGNFIFGFIFLSQLLSQPDFPDSPTQGPIGGFALLAVAGVGLALKKLYNRKK